MNLFLILFIALFFIGFLFIAYTFKNGYAMVAAGILALFLASLIFMSDGNIQKERCGFFNNESVATTVLSTTTTTNSFIQLCANETIVPQTTTDKIVYDALGLLFLITTFGLVLGKVTGEK